MQKSKTIIHANGGTGKKIYFCKKNFWIVLTQEQKSSQRAGGYYDFNHMKKSRWINIKNQFNEQVVIELVFLHIVQRTQYTPGGY